MIYDCYADRWILSAGISLKVKIDRVWNIERHSIWKYLPEQENFDAIHVPNIFFLESLSTKGQLLCIIDNKMVD